MPEVLAAWEPHQGAQLATQVLQTLFPAAQSEDEIQCWRAPGRVNLIGEHLDYNGGAVLPMALPHSTFVAVRPRPDHTVQLATVPLSEAEGPLAEGEGLDPAQAQVWTGQLSDVAPGAEVPTWVKYALGVAWASQPPITELGMDAVIISCLPIGAGLSSSAAIECAVGVGLTELSGRELDRAKLVADCVRAENEVVGAPTGGMDQAASMLSSAGHALFLSCDTGHTEQVPFQLADAGLELLVINTRAPHALVDGQYAQRRASCEAVARREGLTWLAQATDPEGILQRCQDPVERRRARHVFTEQARVKTFVEQLRAGNYAELGHLMTASHASLRDDYQVSCPELDIAVETACAAGALGARMTGGGFGGSAIALVRSQDRDAVERAIETAYAERGWSRPQFLECVPGAAADRC